MSKDTECCNCRFWEQEEEGAYTGICRRYPPSVPKSDVLDGDYVAYPVWPLTLDDEWCGEHKPKENDCDATYSDDE